MTGKIGAMGDVLRPYPQVFAAAWAERRRLEPVRRTRDELAFLPVHLELADSPASPAPRRAQWLIIGLFCVALLWAFLGKLDVVAVAPGKTVTSGRTKVIQPAETAVVRRILVHDGQTVKRGQLLVELDTTATAGVQHRLESYVGATTKSAGNTIPIFAGPDGGAQVRDCKDVAPSGLPPCEIKKRPKGSFLFDEKK